MRPTLIVLLPILLMGSAMGGEPEWEARELERKAKVQALIKQLAGESPKDQQAAYAELRDTFVRKRDIPELTKEIARNANPEVKKSLGELIPFMKKGWRLPEKGWTDDKRECAKAYRKEFEGLGGTAHRCHCDYEPKMFLDLEVFEVPSGAEVRRDAVNLILTLEPESLRLWGTIEPDRADPWEIISFVSLLSNLQELTLFFAPVTDLAPLKGLSELRELNLTLTPVTDLTPLKGLPKLKQLKIVGGNVTDLAPLKGLSSLRELVLNDVAVTDLTPLKGLTELRKLTLLNSPVIDLTPLEGLPKLETLQYVD